MKPLYSENTPSESEADSESENLPFSMFVKDIDDYVNNLMLLLP